MVVWQTGKLIPQVFQCHTAIQELHRKETVEMDSHTDRQHVSEVDRVGEPTHEVLVHSQDVIWIEVCSHRVEPRNVVRCCCCEGIVIKVVKPMWLWEFVTSC